MKRSELYEAVWSKPLFHVARQLGVGDRALTNACKKAAIPTPPRGYWRKVATGQAPSRPDLPPGSWPDVVSLNGGPAICEPEKTATASASWPFAIQSTAPRNAGLGTKPGAVAMSAVRAAAEYERAVAMAFQLRQHRAIRQLVSAVSIRATREPREAALIVLNWVAGMNSHLDSHDPLQQFIEEIKQSGGGADFEARGVLG